MIQPYAPSRRQIRRLAASHPHATNSPADSHPPEILPAKNPISAQKTPHSHGIATNSILSISPQGEALLTNPTFLKLLIPSFTSEKDAPTLAAAQAMLALATKEPPI